MSSTELHERILAFLAGEIARKEGRQCVRVDLLYSPAGFRDEELRTWTRADQPEMFEFVKLPEIVAAIAEIAEGHADTFGMGSHRYTVRTIQHLGGRALHAFKLAPSFGAGTDEPALAMQRGGSNSSATGDAMGVVTQNNLALMRTNQAMFQSSFGTLAGLAENLRKDNITLAAENAALRKKLDEAESIKEQKQFEIAMSMEKNQLKSAGIKQLLQFGTIAMAKFTNGAGGDVAGAPSPLALLVFKFGDSLRPDQVQTMMKLLDMGQTAMFVEIMSMVAPKDDPPPPKSADGAPTPNGSSHA